MRTALARGDNAAAAATHRQGGNVGIPHAADDGWLMCGTCVVPGGPHPACLPAIHALTPAELTTHPFTAVSDMFGTVDSPGPYARYLGVPADELVATAGISHALKILKVIYPGGVAIGPDYTETIREFTVWPGSPFDTPAVRADRLLQAMAQNRGSAVLLSNPSNPGGQDIPCEWLAQIADAHPDTVLVVDEAYGMFRPQADSMLRYPRHNVVVLVSLNKEIAMAGIRFGAARVTDPVLRRQMVQWGLNWPWSKFDVTAALAAVREPEWITRSIDEALGVAADMHTQLVEMFDESARPSPTHFRLLVDLPGHEVRQDLWRHLRNARIDVRMFDDDAPGRVAGLRIAAPTRKGLPRLQEALASFPLAGRR